MTEAAHVDLTDGWVIEANEAEKGEPDLWRTVWETWFITDREEAFKLEKAYSKKGESPDMKPRPFLEVLELLKATRPLDEWHDYRFVHVTGEIFPAIAFGGR